MNGEIYQISGEQFLAMLEDCPDWDKAKSAAKLAADILVGMYNSQPLCYIGLAPPTVLSEYAFVWMITTKAGEEHKFILARHCQKLAETILAKYPKIFGYCYSPESARWLKRLGAEFTSTTEFEIWRK